ncbi:MAG TPA: ATP-binding protein [Burkholderiales bacterium]|nr:ATP-binding protein [Burkholderiales bacterium]
MEASVRGPVSLPEVFLPPEERIPDSFWISLRYFNLYRIVLAAVFLGTALVYDDAVSLGTHNLELFRYLAAGYLFVGVVFHGVLRDLRDKFELQLTLQVCLDIVVITLLMYASGGIRSGLGVMLLISLTGAAIVAPRRLTYLYAALATIALLLEQSYWVLEHDAPTASFLQPALLAIGYFATGGVTSWLAARVVANERLARQRGRELATQTRVNQLVIEDMNEGVLVLDRGGRVVQHNPQAQQLLGTASLLGASIASLVPGFSGSAEIEIAGRDIRLRPLERGAEEFSVLLVEDTTRAREQAQQLKLAALGRLTANIAHEIRNPLAAISHATELLGEEKRAADRERLTRIIHDNAGRLERLVSDVLQLNKRDRVSAAPLRLAPWLGAFISEFVANEAVPPDRIVLETRRESWIEFDHEHLHQVMWNLLRNAVRYAPPDAASIRLRLAGYADRVELSVIDNGPGVPAPIQGQLFEPFFTTEAKGTGLGLYLARELCAANRATLEYVNDTAGAHFRIRCRQVVKK